MQGRRRIRPGDVGDTSRRQGEARHGKRRHQADAGHDAASRGRRARHALALWAVCRAKSVDGGPLGHRSVRRSPRQSDGRQAHRKGGETTQQRGDEAQALHETTMASFRGFANHSEVMAEEPANLHVREMSSLALATGIVDPASVGLWWAIWCRSMSPRLCPLLDPIRGFSRRFAKSSRTFREKEIERLRQQAFSGREPAIREIS